MKFLTNVNTPQLESTVTTGTPPLSVNSETKVGSLNADMLDGYHASDFDKYVKWVLSSGGITSDITAGSTATFSAGTDAALSLSGSTLTISHGNISAASSVSNSQGTVVQSVTLNNNGHVTGLSSTNLDNRYLRLDTADTVTAVHTFSPSATSAPFILGVNAQDQLVVGLNADKLDGNDAAAFALVGHTHDAGDISGTVGDADTVDGEHASAFVHVAGDELTGSLLWAGDQDYDGLYWGAQYKDALAHTGTWAYIRQGITAGQLEIGSDNYINIYETDSRTLAIQISTDSKTLDAKGGLLENGTTLSNKYAPKTHSDSTDLATHGTSTSSIITVGGLTATGTISEGGTELSAKYLGISAKAADSDKLDGHDSTYFAVAGHSHTTTDITDFANNYLSGVSGSGNGSVTFTRSGLTNLTWDASHTHVVADLTDYSDTYLSSVTGSGDGTVTFTLNDTSTITWNAAHTHSEYVTSNNYLDGVTGSANGTATFSRAGLTDITWDTTHTHGTGDISGYSDTYLSSVSGSGDGTVTFTLNDNSTITWNAAHTHSEYLTSELHLDSVSGSGDGTVTFTMSDASTITWNAAHSHSEYSLTSHNHDSTYVNTAGDTMTGDLKVGDNAIVIDGTGRRTSGSGLELYGSTSSALLSTQDGNGRIQLKWNATRGTGETYLVSSEPAYFWDWTISSDPIWEMKYAAGGTAGTAISWSTLLSLASSGNLTASGELYANNSSKVWHEGNFDPSTKEDSLGYTPENVANKGQANGYASLDGNGLVPTSQIPSSYKEIKVVADIVARDALSAFEGLRCHVIDASADSTVDSGWAEYLYTGTAWTKTAESESIDVVVDYNNIENTPTYDNYVSWNLNVNSGTSTAIGSGETVNFVSGSNVSISRSGNTVTISSTDTDTNTWRGIDNTPVNDHTTISISSDWAYHHMSDSSNPHGTTKADVGLGNVPNTNIAYSSPIPADAFTSTQVTNIQNDKLASGARPWTSYLPLSGGSMSGTINMNNNNISGVGVLTINDPGPNEGIVFGGGSGWSIYESPDDLATNSAGNLQIVDSGARVATFRTDGKFDVPGGFKTNKYSFEYNATEDSLDIIYTA